MNFHYAVQNRAAFDFTLNSAATGSLLTGANVDHTRLSHKGSYAYAQASNHTKGDVFLLRTPTVDMTVGTTR